MQGFEFHHFGVAVRKLDASNCGFWKPFRLRIDVGPVRRSIQNVSVCFLSRGDGDPVIELVAPLGPNSPIDRTLKKGGGTINLLPGAGYPWGHRASYWARIFSPERSRSRRGVWDA